MQGRADSAAQDARKIEESAASDLAVAQPALDAAKDAVNCLDKASVTELKSFAKPPSGVDKVTDALLILVKGAGKKGLGWDPAKKMMAKVRSRRFDVRRRLHSISRCRGWFLFRI